MVFGFAKIFVIFLFISVAVGIGTHSWENALSIIGAFIVIRVIWKLFT